MSKLSQLRKKMGYDRDVPRCETCVSFQKPYVYLTTNSNTKKSPNFCKIGGFSVARVGYCDKWTGRNGVKLEQSNNSKKATP